MEVWRRDGDDMFGVLVSCLGGQLLLELLGETTI